ncbi:unnamed protein product [Ixodes pacificus]
MTKLTRPKAQLTVAYWRSDIMINHANHRRQPRCMSRKREQPKQKRGRMSETNATSSRRSTTRASTVGLRSTS